MEKTKKLNLLGQLLLLAATIVWGSSYLILKETIKEVPAFFVISIRFFSSGVILAIIFMKKFKNLNKKTLISGLALGACVAVSFMIQTVGLKNTTPGRNAFLTGAYCVICPFLMWILYKKKPKFYNVFPTIICTIGIGLISLSGDSGSGENVLLGDGLTLLSAVFFALQIIFIYRFQKDGCDTTLLLILELTVVGIIVGFGSLIFELPVYGIKGYALNSQQLLEIGYLALACTLFTQSAQMIGQKFTKPHQSAIILSLEAVFGMLFSVVFGTEQVTIMSGIGFAVVFIAILTCELRFDPLKLIKNRAQKSLNNDETVEKIYKN